jgi:hypothetical protein
MFVYRGTFLLLNYCSSLILAIKRRSGVWLAMQWVVFSRISTGFSAENVCEEVSVRTFWWRHSCHFESVLVVIVLTLLLSLCGVYTHF